MNVFELRDRLVREYASFISSFVHIRDDRTRVHVERCLTEGLLWPDTHIQLFGGTHHTYGYLNQLPIIPLARYQNMTSWCLESRLCAWIRRRILELIFTTSDLKAFAQDCGYEGLTFQWDEERRFLIRCELDAAFSHLYDVERHDVDYIMKSFPIVRRKEKADFAEYLTKRVILEIYDAMTEAICTGRPYQTLLDPPPADPCLSVPQQPIDPGGTKYDRQN